MENGSPLVERMVRLGLTTYEARAYTTLIKRESFTAAQVARQAELPRQRIYDVLGSLVQKGLAVARPGRVVKYAATPPDEGIARLMASRREELAGLERDATDLIGRLTPEYLAGQVHTNPLEYIEILRDKGAIAERFTQLQAQVQREILVFTKPPYARTPQENVEGIAVTRTHEARSLYETSIFDDPDAVEGVRRFIEAGEQARVVPELPLKLVIIDENIVMFGTQDPVAGGSDLTIMVVEHPDLARTLKLAFEAVWARGIPFEDAARLSERRQTVA